MFTSVIKIKTKVKTFVSTIFLFQFTAKKKNLTEAADRPIYANYKTPHFQKKKKGSALH